MGKILLFSLVFFLAPLVCLPSARAQNLAVVVEDFSCVEGKYIIKFGVVNRNTYERNPTIAFKIRGGSGALACKELTLTVPAGSDGSVLQEIALDGPCMKGEATLESRVFDQRDRNRAGPWLSDCPR
jgi:hypothetical protein